MSNKLKAITTKAKALYKTGKFDKWTDAIKAASKTVTTTATKAAKKYGTKAKKYAVKKAKSGVKSLAKKVYESKYLAGTKKAAPKKSAAKSYHKDTASHNVKISVMSGMNGMKKVAQTTIAEKENFLRKIHISLGELMYDLKHSKGQQKKDLLTLKKNYLSASKEIEKEIKYWKKYLK